MMTVSNPLYQMMTQQGPMNGIMQKFQQFQQMFRGDPRQQVQQLLNSGKVSQAQYNQAVQMAQQLQRMLGK
jgi:vancomycin permeability regulator SanA